MLTVQQIDIIYERAFAKLQKINGNAEHFWYAFHICQRLLDYKHKKINAKYAHLDK
jgi:hypothetical protein